MDDLYPWRAADRGLNCLGLSVQVGVHLEADMLVTWSPWNGSRRQHLERHYRAAGRPVIVMENGWLSPIREHVFFQAALDGWNGTGRFPAGGAERWRSWEWPEFPWLTQDSGHVLICGQRGHPSDERTAVPGWHDTVMPAGIDLAAAVRRPRGATRPLLADLRGAREVHVWSSNAASHAVMYGIPVVQHGPTLMVGGLSSRPGAPLYRGDRGAELERLAWAQWTAKEIATGEPFARLLAA